MDDFREHFATNWIGGANNNGVANMYTVDTMVERIINYMNPTSKDNNGIAKFSIVVGSDSQRHGRNRYKFSTSVTVRRMIDDTHGKGGIYFVKNDYNEIIGPPKSAQIVAQKIIQEAIFTTVVAKLIAEKIEKVLDTNDNLIELIDMIDMQLHFDVSETGGSNVALGTVRGIASGSGFDYCIKPYAWAASGVSNKHSK